MPVIGVVLANFLFLSPVREMYEVSKTHHLGEINPIPFAVLSGVATSGLWYAIAIEDWFIFWANAPGSGLSLWFALESIFAIGGSVSGRHIIQILVFNTLFIGIMTAIAFLAMKDDNSAAILLGTVNTLFLVAFYTSPLRNIITVIRTKDASPLLYSLSLMTAINGTVWVIYGFATLNVFVYIPNIFAASFGLIQLVLVMKYPRIKERQKHIAIMNAFELPDVNGMISYAPPMLAEEAMRQVRIQLTDYNTGATLDSVLAAKDVLQAVGLALLQPPKLEQVTVDKLKEMIEDETISVEGGMLEDMELAIDEAGDGIEIPLEFLPTARFLDVVEGADLEAVRDLDRDNNFVMGIAANEGNIGKLQRMISNEPANVSLNVSQGPFAEYDIESHPSETTSGTSNLLK